LTVEEDNVESIFSRIDKMREALRAEYGPDAENIIAEIDRDLEAQLQKDPLLMHAGELFYKANIALRKQRIDTARRLRSDGIAENRGQLELFLWDSRLIDHFTADLRQGERLVQVTGFTLVTNMRTRSRDELKKACRMTVEMNSAAFEKNFTSDAMVHEAEARAAYREQAAAPGRTGVTNSDWPNR
jgi:hypothetical protein